MHAVDFVNCANGISTINNGAPLLPGACRARQDRHQLRRRQHLKNLGFLSWPDRDRYRRKPGLTGVYYDVAYSRNYDAPAKTTGNGLGAGPCTPFAAPTGTTSEYEEGIDIDQTKVNGGAPGAALTDGGSPPSTPRG